ncbi:hypothetical protein F0562_031375 [Nyssa sinensis]|uniref:Bifunctional inhibitor/plant lipid transfer protein/seed storage helical domain-containing protein n=1 Tax=Nyssa sinensis TaxID=561372 RepID=A0A5J5AU23_9ASTE|nr:hypothetical protein F0562_031375 [Nyssa sinensis]
MGSKSSVSAALFLSVNLLCFALVSSCNTCTSPSRPNPNPTTPTPGTNQPLSCPRDALKLGVCANLLGGLVGVVIGTPPTTPCCSLIAGLVDLEAALCLCTAIKANVLGINLNIPLSLSLILTACGNTVPAGGGGQGTFVALTKVKKRRLRDRRRAVAIDPAAISKKIKGLKGFLVLRFKTKILSSTPDDLNISLLTVKVFLVGGHIDQSSLQERCSVGFLKECME